MFAVMSDGAGQVAWREVPEPVVGPGQVLIRVEAAGVNRADLLQAAGAYPPPPGASPALGLECAGRVAALGPGASRWRVGDRVCALVPGGAQAERVAVEEGLVLPIPPGLEAAEAAGLVEAAATAWSNLVDVGGLAERGPGAWVLIHGGSGGVGSIAIQLARALGAHVVTTAGGERGTAFCRELGADVVVDHRADGSAGRRADGVDDQANGAGDRADGSAGRESDGAGDFVAAVLEATGGRGVEVILDVMGAAYLGRNLAALATGGRLVVIGLQGGARAELDLGAMLARRLSVAATTLRSRPLAEREAIVAAVRERVWPLVGERIRPVVAERIPIGEVRRAHARLAGGGVRGKLVLTV